MKVYLNSIGCRLNQSEIESIGRQLLAHGHQIVADPAEADRIIINTCAVTHSAVRDARAQTRRINRLNPNAAIFLTGCYATIAPSELEVLPGTPRTIANKDKGNLVKLLDPQAANSEPLYEREPILREYLSGHFGNTRAFVKIQDGCDNHCTFCVTTIARGRGQSRHLGDVVEEVQALASAGYKEAVLTGVHLGSYGKDLGGQIGLSDLVKAVLEHTDINRLRLSSLEPWDLEPDFFLLWQDQRLQPHLHLPLQSGSDAVLRRMARRTSRKCYRRLAEAARASIPNLNLSTDIILGFPGETEHDFEQSADFIQEIGFSRLHAFTYSRRPGTAAAQMTDQVPKAEKKERTRRIIELGKNLSLDFHQRSEGQNRLVLWERSIGADHNGLRWIGYTDNYIRVITNSSGELFNQITQARLIESQPDSMYVAIGPDQEDMSEDPIRHEGYSSARSSQGSAYQSK